MHAIWLNDPEDLIKFTCCKIKPKEKLEQWLMFWPCRGEQPDVAVFSVILFAPGHPEFPALERGLAQTQVLCLGDA